MVGKVLFAVINIVYFVCVYCCEVYCTANNDDICHGDLSSSSTKSKLVSHQLY